MSGIAPGCDTTGDAGCATVLASGEDGAGSRTVGDERVVGAPPSVAAGALLVPVSARPLLDGAPPSVVGPAAKTSAPPLDVPWGAALSPPLDGAPPSLVDPAVKTSEPLLDVPWGTALSPFEPLSPPASGNGPHPSARLEAKTEVDIRTHRVLRWSFMSYLLEGGLVSRREVWQSAKTWIAKPLAWAVASVLSLLRQRRRSGGKIGK